MKVCSEPSSTALPSPSERNRLVISMKYAAWIVGLSALTFVGIQKYTAQKG